MHSYSGITTHFRMMAREVVEHLEHTHLFLVSPAPRLAERLSAADDYIDLQKSRLEQECFAWLRSTAQADERAAQSVRALGTIVANLERVADLSVDAVRQVSYLSDPSILRDYDIAAAVLPAIEAARRIEPALLERNAALAAQICEAESELDRRYAAAFSRVLADLRAGAAPGERLSVLLIFQCFERVGDALLNIGEAVIQAATGERLKYREARELTSSAGHAGTAAVGALHVRSIWGTRSGVRVGSLQTSESGNARVIFKEGSPAKLAAEEAAAAAWQRAAPGLVPRVLEHRAGVSHSTLLLEYLPGETLQGLLLGAADAAFEPGLRRLLATLSETWSRTVVAAPQPGTFMAQLRERLPDVLRVHPRFGLPARRIGALRTAALEELIDRAAELEAQHPAPLHVFGHGDLNLDNVLYDAQTDRVHFVDLHRSGPQDVAQDAAVLIVSAVRLPIRNPRVRARTRRLGAGVLGIAREFSASRGDTLLDFRLTLGVARALLTATRYEFNRRRAGSLCGRAVYLLEQLAHCAPELEKFRFCDAVLED